MVRRITYYNEDRLDVAKTVKSHAKYYAYVALKKTQIEAKYLLNDLVAIADNTKR